MRPYLASSALILALLVLTVCGYVAPVGHAQSTNDEVASQFVGAWEFVMTEQRQDDGTWVKTAAPPDRIGIIMYTPSGHMSVHLMRRNREITPAYTAYFGRYSVNAQEGYVIHHRAGDLNEKNVGVDGQRFYLFAGDRLTLTVAPANRTRQTWRLLK